MNLTLDQAIEALADRDGELARKDRQVEELTATVTDLRRQIGKQQHQLDQLLRRLYGPRRERFDPKQMAFDELLAGVLENRGAAGAEGVGPTPPILVGPHERRPGHGRLEIPEHIERRVIEIDIPEDQKVCPKTGRPLKCIGHEDTLKLEVVPGRMHVNVYRRLKYVSPDAPAAGVRIPALPYFPIAKCKADTGLLALVLVSKYDDALPLNRQQHIWEREGIELSRTTLDDWVLQSAEVLAPLLPVHKAELLQCEVIGSDDTPVDMLERGRSDTRQTHMWGNLGYREPAPPLVVFEFTPDRTQQRPLDFFGDYRGKVQADAWTGYDKLFEREGVIEVGCWCHARRYFYESRDSNPCEATAVLGEMKLLFAIEAELRLANAGPDQRLEQRQIESRPVVAALFERITRMQGDALPQSPLAKACTYALNQQTPLMRYLEDGYLRMDNNPVELLMRKVGIGRRNWLFFGSERGGRAAAVILSLLQTCNFCKVNPWVYFQDVLRRIPMQPEEKLAELLPQHWSPGPPVPDRIVMPPMPEAPRPLRTPQRL